MSRWGKLLLNDWEIFIILFEFWFNRRTFVPRRQFNSLIIHNPYLSCVIAFDLLAFPSFQPASNVYWMFVCLRVLQINRCERIHNYCCIPIFIYPITSPSASFASKYSTALALLLYGCLFYSLELYRLDGRILFQTSVKMGALVC